MQFPSCLDLFYNQQALETMFTYPALDFLGLPTVILSVSVVGVGAVLFTILDIIPSREVGNAT
jgi:hypothetical protein